MRPTVLIVDDHAAFRASAGALLQAEGFDVVGEAANGVGAVEAVAVLRPEIVLFDIQLPDLDGLAVAEQLAGAPNAPAVVLISSGDAAAYGPASKRRPRGVIPKRGLSGGARRPDRLREMGRQRGLVVGLADGVVGLTAEWVGFGWGDPRHWIPDLAVGWSLIGCGLVASRRRPESHTGLLLAATGFTNAEGHLLRLPAPGSGRSVTVVEREGQPVAALVHDPAGAGGSGAAGGSRLRRSARGRQRSAPGRGAGSGRGAGDIAPADPCSRG